MKVAIVRIGNSKGIRLPKAILEQCNLDDEADLAVRDGQVLIQPLHRVRSGWDAAFEAMQKADDDALLDTNVETTTAWDRSEWRW
ncbi:MAG: AbrB/MazE/SpoVT family DNA-binding domain-containing protein [Gammaproteobacteria bacterium]